MRSSSQTEIGFPAKWSPTRSAAQCNAFLLQPKRRATAQLDVRSPNNSQARPPPAGPLLGQCFKFDRLNDSSFCSRYPLAADHRADSIVRGHYASHTHSHTHMGQRADQIISLYRQV